jgi:SAM-dependent methyltransferase
MVLARHSHEWYLRLAELQDGYFYPWKSRIPPHNGEDTYLELVKLHLSSEKDVIDIGCGHGDVPLLLAPLCKSITGYDRVDKYLQIARANAQKRNLINARFIGGDDNSVGEKSAPIPVADHSFDLFISRRGPTDWFFDVPRAARENAVLIQLNALEALIPPWNDEQPEVFRITNKNRATNEKWPEYIRGSLKEIGIKLHSYWIFDVPQVFESVAEYYKFLSWGYLENEVPAFGECRQALEGIFKKYGDSDGLDIRFRRFLWKGEYRK